MNDNLPDLLAHRLNFDAVVFCGCTMKEMQAIAIVSLTLSSIVLGVLTKLLINMLLIGVGIAFPVAVGMTWSTAHVLQKIKQGKPPGYLKQVFLLQCERLGIMSAIYITRSGKWSVGRKR